MPPRRPAPPRSASIALPNAGVTARLAALAVVLSASGCASLFETDDGDSGPGALFRGAWRGGCEMQLGGNYELELVFQGSENGGVIEASGADAVVMHDDESDEVEGDWEVLADAQLIYLPLDNARLELEMGAIKDGVAPIACAVSVVDGPDDLPECDADSDEAPEDSGGEDDAGEQDCIPREVVARGDGTLHLDG